MAHMSRQARREWGCGWMMADERTANRHPRPQGMPHCDECPGYLIGLPDVLEASRAAAWLESGSLADFFEMPLTPVAKDYIDVVRTAVMDVGRHTMRVARRQNGA